MPRHDKEIKHMARRKEQGLTYSDLSKEFGYSRSTIHRDLNKTKECERKDK